MKPKISMLVILMGALSLAGGGSSSLKLDFERAVLLEEASGKLEEALALYKKIAGNSSDQALAAQAQLRVGMCYEKLGNQEARKAYRVVLEKFASQPEVVRLARDRLARLDSKSPQPQSVTVREFLRGGNWTTAKISDPTIGSGEMSVTRDGQRFIYTDWMTGDLVVKDFSTGKTEALYGVNWSKSTEFFEAPVLSPDEKRIAFVNETYPSPEGVLSRLQIDSIEGGSRETIYEDQVKFPYPFDWSPDGGKILAALAGDDGVVSVALFDVKRKTMQRLVTLNWDYSLRAEFSPDGRFIAYDSTKQGERKIYLISADGLEERILVDSPGEDDSPLWSSDGRFLIFRSNRSGDWDLMALPMDGAQPGGDPFVIKTNIGGATTLRAITSDGRLFYDEQVAGHNIVIAERSNLAGLRVLPKVKTRSNRSPHFSPDGKRLAYIAGGTNRTERPLLRIVDLEGRTLKEIDLGPEYRLLGGAGPAFSPDGKRLAISATRRRQGRILIVSLETGAILSKLTPAISEQSYLLLQGWSRDGEKVYAWVNDRVKKERSVIAIDIRSEKGSVVPLPQRTSFRPPVMSPDAGYFAVEVPADTAPGEEFKSDLVLVPVKDGTEKILMKRQSFQDLAWDFDSRHLFYFREPPSHGDPGKTRRLYRFSIESGREELFAEVPSNVARINASPDGNYLAFLRRDSDIRIWVVENFLPKIKIESAAR